MVNFGFNEDLAVVCGGGNAKCSEFHAAVGLAVLDTIEEKRAKRCTAAMYYNAAFKGVRGANEGCGYQMYPLIFSDDATRNHVSNKLKEKGIGSRIYYNPLHNHPFFKHLHIHPLPITDHIASRILCLPFFDGISYDDMDNIISVIMGITDDIK
jgi:dTDP-4-amino-4,6-dideoxygalactose transaminase